MSENRVLRRIFGPKSDEIKGVWRKLHKGCGENVIMRSLMICTVYPLFFG